MRKILPFEKGRILRTLILNVLLSTQSIALFPIKVNIKLFFCAKSRLFRAGIIHFGKKGRQRGPAEWGWNAALLPRGSGQIRREKIGHCLIEKRGARTVIAVHAPDFFQFCAPSGRRILRPACSLPGSGKPGNPQTPE